MRIMDEIECKGVTFEQRTTNSNVSLLTSAGVPLDARCPEAAHLGRALSPPSLRFHMLLWPLAGPPSPMKCPGQGMWVDLAPGNIRVYLGWGWVVVNSPRIKREAKARVGMTRTIRCLEGRCL